MDHVDAEINASHNEEENDPNIELAFDTSQMLMAIHNVDLTLHNSPDVDGAAENVGIILMAPDGTELFQTTPGNCSAGTDSQQNILGEASGSISHAKRNVLTVDPASHGVFL